MLGGYLDNSKKNKTCSTHKKINNKTPSCDFKCLFFIAFFKTTGKIIGALWSNLIKIAFVIMLYIVFL